MAFRARKGFGTFEKRAPGLKCFPGSDQGKVHGRYMEERKAKRGWGHDKQVASSKFNTSIQKSIPYL